ncbi:MAG: hypothetical protein IME98_05800 [Proteobacteria bacterium]|nr:hypothetical protein [Pseudomonadota bacterium]
MKFLFLVTALFFTLLIGTAEAQDEKSLKTIMTELEADMEGIVRGLNYGDFGAVETHALAVANHPKPPMAQRKEIMTFLGKEMNGFKKGDTLVHNAALKVAEFAKEENYTKVVVGYGVLLGGCVACHAKYRSRIVEHFEER